MASKSKRFLNSDALLKGIMGSVTLERIHEDIEFLKKEVQGIKEHMVDPDTILTEGDRKEIEKAKEEFERGETISLEDLEKELEV